MMRRLLPFFLLLAAPSIASQAQQGYADSLRKIIALGKNDEEERKTISRLAIFYFKSNPALAKQYMLQLLKPATEANDYLRLSSAHSLLLQIYYDEGNPDSALYSINMLKAVSANAPDNNMVQGNCNQAIGLYYKKTGDYKTALPYALAAVKYAEMDKNNKPYAGGQWMNAGDVYLGLGQYRNAMDCNLKALSLFEESGNKRGEGMCYTNLSGLYIQLKQFDNALRAAKKSLEIKTALSDNRGICTALEAIGLANYNLANYTAAYNHYEQALKLAIAEKMPTEEYTCYFNMAKIHAARNNDSLATIYFKKSKALAIQMKNKLVEASVNNELAALAGSADSLKQAEKVLTASLQTFKDAGSLYKESDNYKQLAEFYTATRQYEKALDYTNKYHSIKDSIAGADVQVQFKKLEEQFNNEKKEKLITLLKKDKELQQQELSQQRYLLLGSAALGLLALGGLWLLISRSRLRQKMKELELRNQIAADLHDEVGSSLSSINMLSQMAAQQEGNPAHQDILARMSSNARETMDKMGDIVWMIKPGTTEAGSLKQRMERFAYEISGSKNIALHLSLDELEKIKMTMEQRKNTWLIYKEAVNNAVKYSGTVKLEISAAAGNRQLVLRIKDFGTGFDNGLVKKGNGLDNMRQRAQDMRGSLVIHSIPGQGTELKLTLPV